MPGGRADLGFVAIAVAVAAAIWICACRGWRRAAERAEEVRRLAAMAAAEAARAEEEAMELAYLAVAPAKVMTPVEYDNVRVRGDWAVPVMTPPPPPLPQCAVCYRHTTTRCSRCKAVKYCSGKCQIIHWRQGHKDECSPPRVGDHNNDEGNASDVKGLRSNLSVISDNGSNGETKTKLDAPISNSSSVFGEDHMKAARFVNVSETESTSEDSFADTGSSSSSASCSTFSRLLETSDDASANEDPDVLHHRKVKRASSHDSLPEELITAVYTTVNPKESSPVSECSSADSLSSANNTEQSMCSGKADDIECSSIDPSASSAVGSDSHTKVRHAINSTGSKHDHVPIVSASSSGASSNILTSETRSTNEGLCRSASEGIDQTSDSHSAALCTDNSCPVSSEKSSEVCLLKATITKHLSPSLQLDHESSDGGRHFVSRDPSGTDKNASAPYTKSVESTGSVPNGISDLKTSVRRVVRQFKPSNLSKHALGPRSDISQKHKMPSPYDLFVKLYNDKLEMHPCGLTNCGNSCYANAVLQCLAFTRPLTSYLLRGLHTNICPRRDWCFTCEFASLLGKAKQGHTPLSPIGILSHIQNIGSNLGHGREEDAHEFLRYAIDTMQSVCLREAGTNAAGKLTEDKTLIQLTFGGFLRSKIRCTRCRGKSERQERMMDLTVEIHGDIGTLEEALARFTATEILDGENKYHCSRCKSYERAKKKLTVLEAPNILTIALKRFQSGKFGKLNKAVRFPEILNLAPYMSGTDDKFPVYNLYAVVVHQDIMNAAFSGHYICYVKSTEGKWYKTDDSMVKPVEVGRVLTKNAYMLFYARCSPRAPSSSRSEVPHNHLNHKSKGKDPLSSIHAPSRAQQRTYNDSPCQLHGQHSSVFNRSLPFSRTDSSSDSSSLLSCSDEGSCSTESTRNSTSTEELSEYLFGVSDQYTWNNSSVFSEESDGSLFSPLVSRHNIPGEGKVLSYGDILECERREDVVSLEGSDSPQFLYADGTANECRKLTGDCRNRQTEPNVLIKRSSTARERRPQTYY